MKEITLEYVEEHLPINKSDLDNELAFHAEIQWRISKKLSSLIQVREELKEEEEIISETIKKEIIEQEPNLGVQKVEVRAKIHPKRVAALQDLRHARRDVDLWAALKDAWVGRGFTLKSLCDLYSADYFTKDSHTVEPKAVNSSGSSYERPTRLNNANSVTLAKSRVKLD